MGETQRALNTIQQGADYLSACLVSDSEYVVQVGNYANDLADTSSPEDMTQARPVYTVNATSPGRPCRSACTEAEQLYSMHPVQYDCEVVFVGRCVAALLSAVSGDQVLGPLDVWARWQTTKDRLPIC